MSDEASPPPHRLRQPIVGRVLLAVAVALLALLAKETLLDGDEDRSHTAGAKVRELTVESELLDRELPVEVVVPPGAQRGMRSLIVFLHGRDEDEESYLDEEMFTALARTGGRAPVLAFPGGDGSSYWHDRDSGPWGSYVLDELIPRLVARFGIEPERVAIGGISMGGYGAYHLAAREPERFCAIAGHSPAVWLEAGATAPGAFDDAEGFESNDVLDAVGPPGSPLEGKRAWVDVGRDDPFAEAAGELAEELRASGARVSFRLLPGEHEDSYWRRNWRRYMRFYADALRECARAERQAGRQQTG